MNPTPLAAPAATRSNSRFGRLVDGASRFVAAAGFSAWLLALALALGAGYLASESSRRWREQERMDRLTTEAERRSVDLMSQTLNGNLMGSVAMLGMIDPAVKTEAQGRQAANQAGVLAALESVGRSYDADGVFIVARDGKVGSSWDNSGKRSTGLDVKFRPYYQMAMQGMTNVYAAVSLARGERALYFAAPVFIDNTSATDAIGAVVARTGMLRIDNLLLDRADIALLLSPQGVVFASNRNDWIGRLNGPATTERVKAIRELRQFGNMFDGKLPESLPVPLAAGKVEFDARRYGVATAAVQWNDPMGDWQLVLMEDFTRSVPWQERLGVTAGTAFLSLLLAVMLLKIVQSGYRQRVASRQLEGYAREQEAAATRKGQLAEAAIGMQRAESREALAACFLDQTHRLFGVLQGALYASVPTPAGTATLRLVGSYACADAPPAEIALGEGLLGQCAMERRVQLLDIAPAAFATIRSGLGSMSPVNVLLVPVILGESLLGVAELALPHRLGASEQARLEELVALLAMNLEIADRAVAAAQTLDSTREAERRTGAQLALQQALVDAIPYPVFHKDVNARFVGFNRAYEATFGVDRSALIGKRVLDLDYLPEANRIAYQAEDEATIAAIGKVEREMQIPFADGKLHDTLYFVSGFADADGRPAGLIGTIIDISDIKNAERELDRLADLERFHKLAQGREQRILELKQEINALAAAAGKATTYNTTLVETVEDHVVEPHPDYSTDLGSGRPLRLAELVDLAELQTLFTAFCESVGIAAAIIDLEANVLASSRWQRACTDFHRAHPGSCARCIESDTELALKLKEGEDFTMYQCKNGMTDCASPIIVEGQHLANVFIGQFHLGPPDLEFFRRQSRQFGYDEAEYLRAVEAAPVADATRLPVILGFLTGFARMVSTMSLARHRADAAQARLQEQATLLRRERLAALSLAEDAEQARQALVFLAQEPKS